MKIAILLSTYNGEKFLESQLFSLINQKNNDWHLYIRDDGSFDSTVDIMSLFPVYFIPIFSSQYYYSFKF